MDIRYKNNKIRKVCTEARLARRKYGLSMADLLEVRLKQLIVATSIDWLVKNELVVVILYMGTDWTICYGLNTPISFIFTQYDNTVDIVEIQEIVDYH